MKKLMTLVLFVTSAALFLPTQADVDCALLWGCEGYASCGDQMMWANNCTVVCIGGSSAVCESDELIRPPVIEPGGN